MSCEIKEIEGIGPKYAELLEASGVDTIKELRNRRPENLAQKMKDVNEQKRLVKSSPATSVVEKSVAQAKKIDPKISY